MCERFGFESDTARASRYFALEGPQGTRLARYNIAPSQPLVNIQERFGHGHRSVESYIWSFVPSCAKQPAKYPIDGRCETVATSGLFLSYSPADMRYRYCRKATPSPSCVALISTAVPEERRRGSLNR